MRSRCGLWAVGAAYLAATLWLLLGADAWALNRLTVRLYVALGHVVPAGVLPEQYGVALNVLLFLPLGWLLTRGLGWRSSAVLANGAGSLLGSWLAGRPPERRSHEPG